MTEGSSNTSLADRLGQLVDEATGQTLGQLGAITADSDEAAVFTLPFAAHPQREQLEAAVRERAGDATVVVRPARRMPGYGSVIAVGSGKGGVGKSTVAATVALGLQELGASVGLLDADVYGPSIPHMFGSTGKPAVMQQPGPDGQPLEKLVPIEASGIKLMSMGFMVEPDKAVVWRGPMLHRALTQFLTQTAWGELDYLVVDMPPGTGDVALTLAQSSSLAGAVVVCSPQQVALLDAGKAISMFRQVEIPVLGMVENMAGEVFGRGGAREKATAMEVPFLGELSLDPSVRVAGDEGRIAEALAEGAPLREELLAIAGRIAVEAYKAQAARPAELPTL